jgi:hypothetical protein
VSVEKLILARLAENSSRQDALQAIFSGWVDIFYHRIRGRFRRKRVFQQPRANALIETVAESDAASRWPHLPGRPLKMILFVL